MGQILGAAWWGIVEEFRESNSGPLSNSMCLPLLVGNVNVILVMTPQSRKKEKRKFYKWGLLSLFKVKFVINNRDIKPAFLENHVIEIWLMLNMFFCYIHYWTTFRLLLLVLLIRFVCNLMNITVSKKKIGTQIIFPAK